MQRRGGVGETKEATGEVQELCEKAIILDWRHSRTCYVSSQYQQPVKVEVEEKCGKNFTKFDAVCYKTQVVAGKNYFVKIDTGDSFIHVRIYVALPHENQPPSFHGVQQDKTKEDEILHF